MITKEDYNEFRAMVMAEAKRKRDAYIKRMKPSWRKAGEKLRKMREGLCISRHEVAGLI